MSAQIHDDEPDTGEEVVRTLLAAECATWATAPIEYLETTGTDNAMWRIHVDAGPDLVVRLPRSPSAAAGARREVETLQRLHAVTARTVAVPRVRHVGSPHEVFPHHWSILEWIDGRDAWAARDDLSAWSNRTLAQDMATAVDEIGRIDTVGAATRTEGSRGGPLRPLLERLDFWLTSPEWHAGDLLDVGAIRCLAAEVLEIVDEPVTIGFVHGDLIPGNVLLARDRLAAIIDWGGAGCGDIAQDLAPAWSLFDEPHRTTFRDAVGVDDASWIRSRAFELEHAVGGILYYVPRRHPLGDVMAATLDRILDSV